MRMQWSTTLALAASLFVAPAAWSAATGTLSFTTPAASVGPLDVIDVYLTLQLDPDSDPITTDASGNVTSGFDIADLPDGFVPTSSHTNTFFTCTGTFTSSCTAGPPYDFSFASTGPFSFGTDVHLPAGSSTTFLFGSFTPTNGQPVAPGTYTFFRAGIFLQFYDDNQEDPENPGQPLAVSMDLAATCAQQGACSFERTVVAAVPEPGTYAMLLAGLGLMGWIVRQRARHP